MLLETAISAIVGLLGTSLTTYSNYKMKQLEADNQIKLLEAQSRQAISEAEANMKVAQTNAQVQMNLAESQSYTASIQSQKPALPSEWLNALLKQRGWMSYLTYPVAVLLLMLMGLADVVNSMMRPILTLYSLGIASWVTHRCYTILQAASITTEDAVANWHDSTTVVLMLAVTMTTWWFGDRRVAQHLQHMEEEKKNA